MDICGTTYMDQTALQSYLKKVSKKISDEDIPFLVEWTHKRELKRGEILLREGEVCRSFYLVEKGHLRTYYNKDGVTINLHFAFEGDYAANLRSATSKQPSEQIIEAGEDTSVWVFNLNLVSATIEDRPQIKNFIRRLALHLLLASEEHSNLFKMYTPTERYRYIEKNNPQLLQRISLSQLASYLGVSRETLSRIRGKRD
jgi:CRP-like cAMP-binding protein